MPIDKQQAGANAKEYAPYAAMGLLGPVGGAGAALYGAKKLKQMTDSGDPAQASVDPNLEKTVQAQQQAAQQYRQSLPGLQSQQYEGQANDARRALSQRMSDIKSGASSRGLLYSGLRQGEEAGAAADSAGQLARQRADINKQTEQQAQGMENQAVQSGVQLQQQKQQIADYNYNNQLQAQQQRQSLMKGLGSSAGGLIGTMGGK